MLEVEAAAQGALKRVVRELEAIQATLQEVHESLPVPPREPAMLSGEEELDISMEVRSVIECVLHDRIQPAILSFSAAAVYRPGQEGGAEG